MGIDMSERHESETESDVEEACGFAMVYTYAAWCTVPFPLTTSGEDICLLRAFRSAGLSVTSRAETGNMTFLHLQHGRNFGRCVCRKPRFDDSVKTMISRFETACRRIINLSQAEYDQMGGKLLYPALHSISVLREVPAASSMK